MTTSNLFKLRKSWGLLALIAAGMTCSTSSYAADGTWIRIGSTGTDWSGNWSETNRWEGGTIADGAGFTANFAGVNISSAGMTVTLDSHRTIGNLYIGDSGGTAGGATITTGNSSLLTFDNTGSASLLRMGNPAGGGGPSSQAAFSNIAAGIWLNNSLNVENNFSVAGAVLRLNGDISTTTSGLKTITHVTNAGDRANAGVIINGAISDGIGQIAVVQNSSTGSLTLTNENSHTGGTTVSLGRLLVTGDGTLGAGNVHVGTGGTLDIAGIDAGSYQFATTQTVSGAGLIEATAKSLFIAGTLASEDLEINGHLTLGATATTIFSLGGTEAGEYDYLTVNGLLNLGGTLALDTTYTVQYGDTIDLFNGLFIQGAFSDFIGLDLGNGLSWDVSNVHIDGTITAIPEPGTVSLLALCGVAGIALQRLRRKRLSS